MARWKILSDSFTRAANTTAYAAGDSVAPVQRAVSGASNASPIEITTSVAHGWATGDRVTIASVGGNTAANGDWVITVTSTTKFTLDGSTGNGAYTSGGTVERLMRLANAGLRGTINYGQGRIIKTRLVVDEAVVTNGTFRVYYYKQQITQITDNAAWTFLYANKGKLIGISANLVLATEGSGSDGAAAQDVASSIPYVLDAGDHIYAVLLAEAAYTPKSGGAFYLETWIEQG